MVSVIQLLSPPEPGLPKREAALDAIALAAALLFAHGQTTERIVVAAERLRRAFGVPVTALPYWGQLTVEIDGTSSAPAPLVADVIAAGCAVAAFGTFFSMPWRLLPLPIAVGMFAHAVRWAVISMASANAATGAFVACIIVSVIVTPVANRLHLPFAALGFTAVVSMMPGFFLFHTASALVELVSIGPRAPAALLTSAAVNGITAFLVILAMTMGLILLRLLFEHFLPAPE